MFIDTHAHTYDEVFENDLKEIVDKSIANSVQKVFLPNVDLDSIEPMFALNKNFPNHFYPMMGLHPCYVKEDYKDVLPKMEALLKEKRESDFWDRRDRVGLLLGYYFQGSAENFIIETYRMGIGF
jgi:Tat protein secretion system quality control protein TatD with DNase activity